MATENGTSQYARAFTLAEMLVVMAVIALIIGLSAPAMNSLKGAGDVSRAVYDIAGTLEQARAYAMANNTYVYVGFHEADASKPETGPQTDIIGTNAAGGRVSMAVIARKDGVRGYDVNDPSSWAQNYGTGANFLVIGKVQRFYNLHIVNLGYSDNPDNNRMYRPTPDPTSSVSYNLADPACAPVTTFVYPLGASLGGSGAYTFTKVIQYDPQGVARIQPQGTSDTVARHLEIDLTQTQGNLVPSLATPATTGSIAAIQIDGITGTSHIYRP